MKYSNDEIREILEEGEIAYISAEFWFQGHDRLDPSKSLEPAMYDQLLAFQNGWQACKEYYGVST